MSFIIEPENLVKQYGDNKVVNQVNMHVPKGKIYGLLGRNGAGKTTTMKMLLQLIKPTSGKMILFGEQDQKQISKVYTQIGSIIETPGFYENLTARENLRLLQRLRRQKKEEDINWALSRVGLDKEEHKCFSDYSLGMKQRLGIAAAIMHKPKLLILDEPINGLDPIGIAEIRSFLARLSHEEGTTILISSHVLSEIEQLADIIGVMHGGCLIEEETIEKLNQRKGKYAQLNVSDVYIASNVLERDYHITSYKKDECGVLWLYEGFEQLGDINTSLVKAGVSVNQLATYEESLEAYFSNLIGGGGIA